MAGKHSVEYHFNLEIEISPALSNIYLEWQGTDQLGEMNDPSVYDGFRVHEFSSRVDADQPCFRMPQWPLTQLDLE